MLDQYSNAFMHPQISSRHDADEPRPFLQDAFPAIDHLGESGNGWVKLCADANISRGMNMCGAACSEQRRILRSVDVEEPEEPFLHP
jgi:hypothetical protein